MCEARSFVPYATLLTKNLDTHSAPKAPVNVPGSPTRPKPPAFTIRTLQAHRKASTSRRIHAFTPALLFHHLIHASSIRSNWRRGDTPGSLFRLDRPAYLSVYATRLIYLQKARYARDSLLLPNEVHRPVSRAASIARFSSSTGQGQDTTRCPPTALSSSAGSSSRIGTFTRACELAILSSRASRYS